MDGQLIQKKDCSAAVQAAMPEAKSLAQVREGSIRSIRSREVIRTMVGLGWVRLGHGGITHQSAHGPIPLPHTIPPTHRRASWRRRWSC